LGKEGGKKDREGRMRALQKKEKIGRVGLYGWQGEKSAGQII